MARFIRYLLFCLICGIVFLVGIACTKSSDSMEIFECISPEEAGFSAKKLALVEKFCELSGSAALLIIYDGKCVLSWGNVEKKYPMHSIRKALLNGLYGIYVDRGIIDTNATLAKLGIDDVPPRLTETERQATIADLLGSRSGVYHPAACEAAGMINCRPQRGSHAPGTHFYYNNWDFNVLGTIFEQVTGEKIFETFYKEIAMPLDMKHFTPEDGKRFQEENKSLHPTHHFWMTAQDMALYGLLYLKKGYWNGTQLISKDWIEKSTTFRSVYSQELGLGYGWLWLVFSEDAGVGKAYLHTGAGVHMLAVLKDLNLVIVHRVDSEKVDSEIMFTNDDLIFLFELILSAIKTDKG